MVKKKSKKNNLKKISKLIVKYASVIFLCAFSTVVLLLIVGMQSGTNDITGFTIAEVPGIAGLNISAVGIFFVILAGFLLYHFKK
ncbi:MAG: hypothetical protein U9R08_04650 [Nanoarchaeota archaeon]|nr:hypothetical protein [Nanoarchaeota archaeon]